ncbi:MAG: class I SAM-dependent methyltransferase [Nitrospirae bacterium]|nr:class I SAM-dependent methyltransferase [Nitrospirota bacterium]
MRCRKCSLKSLYPLPTEKDLAIIYDNYADKGSRARVEEIRKQFVYPRKIELLKKHTKGKRLLDIGAGLGTFVHMAQQQGFHAVGIEYEIKQCEIAKSKYGIELVNGTFEEISSQYQNEIFDIIHMHHVLEHLISPRIVLQKIYHLLANNGILLIEVPNQFDNIFFKYKYLRGGKYPKYDNPLHHCYFFTPKTLRAYMIKTGFIIVTLNQYIKENEKNKCKHLIKFLFDRVGFGVSSFIEILAIKRTRT